MTVMPGDETPNELKQLKHMRDFSFVEIDDLNNLILIEQTKMQTIIN